MQDQRIASDNLACFDVLSAIDTIRQLDFIRVCGSEGERRAMDMLAGKLDEIGVGWHYHSFRDKWLEADDAHLMLRDTKITVRPAMEPSFQWGLDFSKSEALHVDVRAELAPAGNCCGKIAVSEQFNSERPLECEAAAQLMAFPFDPEMEAFLWAAHDYGTVPIPTAIVLPRDIPLVTGSLGEPAVLRWSVRSVEREFRNLVAQIPGKTRPDEIVVMGAHIDSFPGTVGASDDAAGCAVLIEAAKWFIKNPPDRTVRLVWFTGEEVDARGSLAYVRDYVNDPTKVKLMVCVDSGCEMHTGPFTVYTSDESTFEWADQRLDLAGKEHCVVSNPGTDAKAFIRAGVPTFAVEAPCKQRSHLPDDSPENIDPDKVAVLGSLSLQAAIHGACDVALDR